MIARAGGRAPPVDVLRKHDAPSKRVISVEAGGRGERQDPSLQLDPDHSRIEAAAEDPDPEFVRTVDDADFGQPRPASGVPHGGTRQKSLLDAETEAFQGRKTFGVRTRPAPASSENPHDAPPAGWGSFYPK